MYEHSSVVDILPPNQTIQYLAMYTTSYFTLLIFYFMREAFQIRMHVYIYVCMYVHTYVCICVCVCVCVRERERERERVYIYIYMYIYIWYPRAPRCRKWGAPPKRVLSGLEYFFWSNSLRTEEGSVRPGHWCYAVVRLVQAAA